MTRTTRGDQVQVAPTNDVYTGLAAAAVVVLIIGLISLFTQSNAVFNDGLFLSNGTAVSSGR